jgi:protein TonB
MDKSFNIIISTFISIGIYMLIILLFILYLNNPVIKKYNAIKQDTVIELDIIINEKENDTNLLKNTQPVIKIQKDIKVDKSSSTSAIKKSNLKSLFANVSTKSTEIKNEKVLNIKKNDVNSRFKSSYKNNKAKSELKISKLNNVKSKKNTIVTKNDSNYDKYYSKINTIILNRWYKYPLYTKEAYRVKVQINISNKGVFSYNIISFSGNLNIDNAISEFLKTQQNKIYPLAEDNMAKNIIINFINDKN